MESGRTTWSTSLPVCVGVLVGKARGLAGTKTLFSTSAQAQSSYTGLHQHRRTGTLGEGRGYYTTYYQYSHTPLWVPCPDPLRGFHAGQLRHEKGSLDIIFLCHTAKYLKRTFTSCPLASLYCCPLPLNYAYLVACYEIENRNNLK